MSRWYNVEKHHLDETTPICPYCDREIEESWEWRLKVDVIEKRECDHCEKEFFVILEVPKFTTWEIK
jgi:hypothetical protein